MKCIAPIEKKITRFAIMLTATCLKTLASLTDNLVERNLTEQCVMVINLNRIKSEINFVPGY